MKPLTILHTVEHYHPHTGGSELVVQNLSERLAARGHRVVVATSKDPGRTQYQLNGVEIIDFDIQGGIGNGLFGADVEAYRYFICKFPADVMLNYAAQQWATDVAFTTLDDGRRGKVNILAPCGYSAMSDARTLKCPEYFAYYSDYIPNILPLYDACVYHSALYKDYEFAQIHGFNNSVIIPNAVDEKEFEAVSSCDFRSKYEIKTRNMLLCVANFYPLKGQNHLIDLFRRWAPKDTTLVLIGNDHGTLADMQTLAGGLNVRFLTNVPRADTVAAFKSADLFLFASEIEASPLVIIEAKAAKLPFVSTDCGNVREWQGGIVCDVSEMAAYADVLLSDPARRAELGMSGYREWKESLTWDRVIDRYEDLYIKLYEKKHGVAIRTPQFLANGITVEQTGVSPTVHHPQFLANGITVEQAGANPSVRRPLVLK